MWRLFLAGSGCASCRALVSASAHLILTEGQGLDFTWYFATVQKCATQERQFLYSDAIPLYQREIGPNRAFGPRTVLFLALECEHAESHLVSEPGDHELHFCAPLGHHADPEACRLQVGSYSSTRRSCRDGRRAPSHVSKTNPVGCRFISDA
jgi:hypothetical protein